MSEKRLDLAHLIRIGAILEGIPGDTDLPNAIVALEDALVVCGLALRTGVSLARAIQMHQEVITKEETRRVLAEHRLRS